MCNRKTVIFWLLSFVGTWLGLLLIYGWRENPFMLEVYDYSATTMLQGISPEKGAGWMAYPPPLIATYIPFVHFSVLAQKIAMLGLMSGIILFIFGTIQHKLVGERTSKSAVFFWVLLVLLVGRFIASPIENFSNDILVAGLVFFAIRLWSEEKNISGSIAMGVAAALKATPLLFLPYLIFRKSWKSFFVVLLASAAIFWLPDLFFPKESGTWGAYWISIVANSLHNPSESGVVGSWSNWNHLNQSLSGTIERLFTHPPVSNKEAVDVCIASFSKEQLGLAIWLGRTTILLLIFAALWQAPKEDKRIQKFSECALIICGMLLLSPMSSKAHFFLLILPAAIIVRHYVWKNKDIWLTIIFVVVFLYGTMTVKDLIGTKAGHAVLATGSVTWCTLLIMLGVWRVLAVQESQSSFGSSRQ